jgi:Cu-processing system ATP-binding protein
VKSLSARGVFVRLGPVQALDDVRIELTAGVATMLAGPNGAGKSTFMKVLLGLIRPDHGAFAVDGEPVAIDNDWKRRIGYMPESVAFSDNLSGQQVLRFFARARGVNRARVDAVLDQVGLEHVRRRTVRGYSHGMRQRLGLAVAILANPELLILDEPTAGLDQEGLSVLWSVLEEWRAAGRMVLLSTHDLALAERRVDGICVLRAGHVIAHGTAEDLRRAARLAHRVIFDVVENDPRVGLLAEAITKWGQGTVARSAGRLIVEVAPDSVLEVMEIQGGFRETVRSLRIEEPTLDLVYEKLLGAA